MAKLTITLPFQGEQLHLFPSHPITSRTDSTVTHNKTTEKEPETWADYSPEIEQLHTAKKAYAPKQRSQSRQRRYSPKGKATGWIEERQGNLKRKHPSTSYYYCWQNGDQRGKTYIPVRQINQIRIMVDARCSVDEILSTLTKLQPITQPYPQNNE